MLSCEKAGRTRAKPSPLSALVALGITPSALASALATPNIKVREGSDRRGLMGARAMSSPIRT
jgi:hypothetical protein